MTTNILSVVFVFHQLCRIMKFKKKGFRLHFLLPILKSRKRHLFQVSYPWSTQRLPACGACSTAAFPILLYFPPCLITDHESILLPALLQPAFADSGQFHLKYFLKACSKTGKSDSCCAYVTVCPMLHMKRHIRHLRFGS